MKKVTLLSISLVLFIATHAATGWYQDYVLFSINNSSNAYYWIGSNPSFGTQLNGNNFGTISTLRITGCDMKYWGTNADRTGGAFYYKIMDASNSTQIVAATEILWNQNSLGGNDFKGTSANTIDLLSNLTPNTTYKLHVWAKSWGSSQGDSWLSNNGNDYVATFTTPAYFRSNNSGTWNTNSTWYSSNDGSNNWLQSSIIPTSAATNVNILTGHEVTMTSNATAPNIIVQAGGKLTLNSGYSLSANNITLQSDATNGTATLVNKNTNGGITLTNNAIMQQYLTSGRNWYICAPIPGSTSNVFSASLSSPMYYYNETTGTSNGWQPITNTSTILEDGKGYIATVSTDGVSTFSGTTFNDGNINIPLTRTAGQSKEGFNLIGNPYPSFLDVSSFTSNSDLIPTYWYRSKNGTYIFDTYNIPSGISTGNSGYTITNLIPPMQAFWVRVKSGISTTTLNLTNSMRAHQDYSNNRFRTRTQPNNTTIIRIQIANNNYSDEAVLFQNPEASNDFDDYDSPKLNNYKADMPEIYFGSSSNSLAIDGVHSISNDIEIPLGVYTGSKGIYTIKAQNSLLPTDQKLFIKDNIARTTQEITETGTYTFTADSINTDTRFSLIMKSGSITTDIQTLAESNRLIISQDKNELTVKSLDKPITQIDLYSCSGQRISTGQYFTEEKRLTKPDTKGIYIVKATIDNKPYYSKIIIY